MDMSKAFDMAEWGELLSTFRKRKWKGETSHLFDVRNGVRQGAVSSVMIFAVYIDEILALLQESRLG